MLEGGFKLTESFVQSKYLVYDIDSHSLGEFTDPELLTKKERHRFELPEVVEIGLGIHGVSELLPNYSGVVIISTSGIVGLAILREIRSWRRAGSRVYVYFPNEGALEFVSDAQWTQQIKLKLAEIIWKLPKKLFRRNSIVDRSGSVEIEMEQISIPEPLRFAKFATPVNLKVTDRNSEPCVEGLGLYLRTDYWAQLTSGGSYGHTCYIAKSLASMCDEFLCILPNEYALLTQWGIRQHLIKPEITRANEEQLLGATKLYAQAAFSLVDYLKPAFIYERLVLGNYAGAVLSRALEIPYIVEYNGSELEMALAFGQPYINSRAFLAIENAAFSQACVISVISEGVREQVVARGVDPRRVIVSPNGVDCLDYCPGTEEEKKALRLELGISKDEVVVGFVGTFGGWHGIEVLAQAIPVICRLNQKVRFLLIGNGNYRHLIDEVISDHSLSDRVILTGSLEQEEAARVMRVADVLVSPHNKSIGANGFFGSPTKIFEYLALGAAIVSTDLGQISNTLSPSLSALEISRGNVRITNQRAILCTPGSVNEFVEAVIFLSENKEVRDSLGVNARRAAEKEFTWDQRIRDVLQFASNAPESVLGAQEQEESEGSGARAGEDLDPFKLEAQLQWDEDPCGSHYVEVGEDRAKFFFDVEVHRYREYAPWMPGMMEFSEHKGEAVLEIGAGMGTDLAQFALNGSLVTDLELSAGHMALAKENFALRNLAGDFISGDAENLPFAEETFDLVYSNGVIHHIPDTQRTIDEIYRVLKPGGKAIIMVYRENSKAYWHNVRQIGFKGGELSRYSMNEIMSRTFEISDSGARPLVKVYTSQQLREMFKNFENVSIYRRQLTRPEVPRSLRWLPTGLVERLIGWNFVIKAQRAAK